MYSFVKRRPELFLNSNLKNKDINGVSYLKKVLIVDDAMFMRESIKMMLKGTDFEVIGEAENGLLAFEKYKSLMPDLVTMDISMPEMDGISAIKEIIKLDSNAKIIVISAMGQETKVREAIIAGASSFIVKPFDAQLLVNTLLKF